MPRRGDILGPASYHGAPGWILRRQESAERFQALITVAVDLSRLQRGQRRLVRQTTQSQWDVISMLHRSELGAEAHLLTNLSKTMWTTCCEAA
jgi:hypothetical protein